MPTNTATWGLTVPAPTDAPDGPGAIQALATSVEKTLGTRRAVLQQNGAATAGTSGIDLAPDTVISDPSGMRSGSGFLLPWAGLYAIGARAAVNGGDLLNVSVLIDCIDSSSGAVYGQVGQPGMYSDVPMLYQDEVAFAAGTGIRFRLRWSGGASRGLSYGANNTCARIWAQYLGPA